MSRRPKAVDLFCGAGGMSLGFERAGFDIVLSVDFDPYHVAAHKRNFPYGEAWVKSVTELDGHALVERFGQIDVLFGGPPCQGFSHMGLRQMDDSRNELVREFVRLIDEIRPKAVVMENVPGLATGAARQVLDYVIQELKRIGFDVTHPVRILNAFDYGVPQSRERLFLLAIQPGFRKRPLIYPSPNPTTVNVWEAIADLPSVKAVPDSHAESRPYENAPHSLYARLARGWNRDEHDYSRPREWDSDICAGCAPVNHESRTISLYAATPPGQMVPGHKLPRLAKDGHCPTLRAGSTSDHGSHTAPRPIHPIEPRCITVREAARLHGYPDWFNFYPSKWHAYRQIGNSVCPPVAHQIGLQVALALGLEGNREETPPCRLSSTFDLDKREKNHARLKDVEELPKVLKLLLERSLEKDLMEFGVDDIERAIRDSEARLPRISASNFLKSVSKSRNVTKILAELRSAGWSVRCLAGGGGEFVAQGSLDSLETKDQLSIQSAELTAAVPSESIAGSPEELERAEVWTHLRASGWTKFKLHRDLFGTLADPPTFEALTREKTWKTGMIVSSIGATLPRKSALRVALKQHSMELAIVIGRLTHDHTLISAFEERQGNLAEIARVVFTQGLYARELVTA